jgi:hypothetical protein
MNYLLKKQGRKEGMNEKEICMHLDSKLEEFLSRIEDLELKDALKEKLYFAGGCIYCLRNDKTPKDYDMFLMDDELIERLKNLDIWSFTSDYALTCGKFQIVIKYFGEPDDCVGQFDFKHNMHYYIPGTGKIMCGYTDELHRDPDIDDYIYLETNELHFNENRARDIEGVWLRIKKFTDRGMTISKETKKKIKQRTTKKSIKAYKKSRSGGRKSYY